MVLNYVLKIKIALTLVNLNNECEKTKNRGSTKSFIIWIHLKGAYSKQ